MYDAIELLIKAVIDEEECIRMVQRLTGKQSIRNLADKLRQMLKSMNYIIVI